MLVLVVIASIFLATTAADGFDNCIALDDSLRLSWTLDTDAEVATFQLCGCVTLKTSVDNQYLGFGLSGSDNETLMLGADATIAWVDDDTGAHAEDYHLSAYLPCRQGNGACPDTVDAGGNCTNDVFNISGFVEEDQQCITYSRPFRSNDSDCDLILDPDNENQYIVWSIGGLGETAFRHFKNAPSDSAPLHFGRTPSNDCPSEPLVCNECGPFEGATIVALDDTHFTAQIGNPGQERGYLGITGQAGWGYSWYINNILVPELMVQRGKTYTFTVEGGDDPVISGQYHPFYITDSRNGGRLLNEDDQREGERVYAGFNEDDEPTGTGRYCELKETATSRDFRENCGSREQYEMSLTPDCKSGEPGILTWVPDDDTPDLVYYQCASHQNFGWKIHVMGSIGDDGDDGDDDDDDDDDDDGSSAATASWLLTCMLTILAIAVSLKM